MSTELNSSNSVEVMQSSANITNPVLAVVNCVEIEVAIMREFDFRQNLIVPNISNQMGIVAFETDVLVLTKSNYAYGFEIKVSKSDLKADFKKPQHIKFNEMRNGKTGLERFYGKLKHFSYAVPEQIKECALELIPVAVRFHHTPPAGMQSVDVGRMPAAKKTVLIKPLRVGESQGPHGSHLEIHG